MNIFKLFFAVLALAIPLSTNASMSKMRANLFGERWGAKWCDDGGADTTSYKVLHFRRTFDLREIPQTLKINISADNRFKLFVNGAQVATGPARGDFYNWFYDTVDIAPFLKKGKNTIAVLVWNAGEFAPAAQLTRRIGFILDGADKSADFLSTPKNWKVKKSAAYTPVESFALDTGAGDEIDASKYDWGWTLPDFDDSKWSSPRGFANGFSSAGATGTVSWMLRPREIPQPESKDIRFAEIRRARGLASVPDFVSGRTPLKIPANTKCEILLDMRELTTAYPVLKTSGGKGARVEIKYAEALFDSKQNKANRDEIEGRDFHPRRLTRDIVHTDGSPAREFTTLWWRAFRYVGIFVETKSEPLVIDDFFAKYSAYPFKEVGSFDSDDKSIGKIWEVGWRTARLCANETYVDCPYYEQLQYVGDTRIQALISLAVSGDDRLMRSAIEMFDSSRSSFGLTGSRYPSRVEQIIPPFSLFWISMLRDYTLWRGDSAFVQKRLDGVRTVLAWYMKQIDPSTGMLRHSLPFWNFADWVTSTGERKGTHSSGWFLGIPPESPTCGSTVNTLHLAIAMRDASMIMHAAGENSDADRYFSEYQKIVKSVNERCFDKSRGAYLDYEGAKSSSIHANILAILADALDAKESRALFDKISSDKSFVPCTFYYMFYYTEAMRKTGRGDMYVKSLAPWRDMIAEGLTTFAENPAPSRSDCHAWSASPNYHLLTLVCGITPASEGFSSVNVEPNFGGLSKISGVMAHPLGKIRAELSRDGNRVSGIVELPSKLSGTFKWCGKSVPLASGINKINID